ncbi:MAG: hypothetical protein AAF587_15810 [Bacteroidota bacterium]
MESANKELILESIRNDVAQIGRDLQIIAKRVIEEGISEYPIFVAAQKILDIGKLIFDPETANLNWYFFASMLEDFINRDIIQRSKVKEFQDAYGDPLEKACILVLTEESMQIVFVPYDLQ